MDHAEPRVSAPAFWLVGLLGVQAFIYREIARLSSHFGYYAETRDRPILAVVLLFTLAFVGYLAAGAIVHRFPRKRGILPVIVIGAVIFRLLMISSTPIQEVDVYRYLWDGVVSDAGVSPYRFSPHQVLADTERSRNQSKAVSDDLSRLSRLCEVSPPIEELCRRVHFGQLPTIYPPVSQWVFHLVGSLHDSKATVEQRLMTMKWVLSGFDVATLAIVIALLHTTGLPVSWSVLYAWCPLLLKEVTNSAHLDAIAVFFVSLFALVVVRSWSRDDESPAVTSPKLMEVGCAPGLLSLGIGSKLFPVVVAPAFLWSLVRRRGWRSALIASTVLTVATWGCLAPMLMDRSNSLQPSTPNDSIDNAHHQLAPTDGLNAFLRSWEINDFLFLIVIENLKPNAVVAEEYRAWFVVVPDDLRGALCDRVQSLVGVELAEAPFFLARAITAVVFFGVVALLLRRLHGCVSAEDWLRTVFGTLAWFWLLCPTQNPWYLTWILPFLPFARQRAWWLLSGLAMVYYLRFWMIYQWPNDPVIPGLKYHGAAFFDLVVTWLEFAPWFILLTLETWKQRDRAAA